MQQNYSLVGTWRGTVRTGIGDILYETTLNQDLTFGTTVRSSGGPSRTSGTYRVLNGNVIEFTNLQKGPDKQIVPGPLVGSPVGPLDYRTARWSTVYDVHIEDKGSVSFYFVDENTMVAQAAGTPPVIFTRNGVFPSVDPFATPAFPYPAGGGSSAAPGNVSPVSSDKMVLYMVVAFFLITTLLAYLGAPKMW